MRNLIGVTAVALAVAATPAVSLAQLPFRLGGQLSWGDDKDLGLGIRYENDLTMFGPAVRNLRVIGSFDYFFPGNNVNYFEFNANVAWGFSIPGSRIAPYAGGGINIARGSVDLPAPLGDRSDTDVGLNLLGGVKFPALGKFTPYTELRLELSGGDQFVITGGLLFF